MDALAERVEQLVVSSLADLNGSLEQLVDQALERHLPELVDARVRERLAPAERSAEPRSDEDLPLPEAT